MATTECPQIMCKNRNGIFSVVVCRTEVGISLECLELLYECSAECVSLEENCLDSNHLF